MSPNHRSIPIHALNDDVLLRIFEFNADMFSDSDALRTTRIASQVCRQWRVLALDTPSLWAKLIDINSISERGTKKWRDELIRRTGAAPLWVRACGNIAAGSKRGQGTVRFFFDLVTRNMHRIQRLVVRVPWSSSFMLALPMLCAPAPQLESCEASFGWMMAAADHDAPTAPLFANYAPMLRKFHLGGCHIDPRAPWLCHLYSLTIGSMCSVRRTLSVLAATQSLQELKIESIPLDTVATSLHIVSLPHLKCLEYKGLSESGAALLNHLAIPADCSLIVEIKFASLPEEKAHLLSIINVFAQHAEVSLQSHIFNATNLSYARKHYISLECFQNRRPALTGLLSIRIPLDGDSDSNLLEAFLKRLLTLDLTSVKKFTPNVDGCLNPCFGPFFSCLPSVEIMFVSLQGLSHLAHLQAKYISKETKKPIIMFPALDVIKLPRTCWSIYSSYSKRRNYYINRVAGAYLLLRLRAGHPITRFDISSLALPLDRPPNLDALSDVKGLKVLYRLKTVKSVGMVEYTCGCDNGK